jgi:hypothetical protein
MLKRFPIQFIRIVNLSLTALAALHQMKEQNSLSWKAEVLSRVKRLRAEALPHATILADYYEGLLHAFESSIRSDFELAIKARGSLERAASQAAFEGLRPLCLASNDAISQLPGQSNNLASDRNESLQDLMREQGVVFPEKLARLYTIDLKPIR